MMAIAGLGTVADALIAQSFSAPGRLGLVGYVSHLDAVVSGLEAAFGLLVASLAWYGIRRGYRWAWITTVGAFLMVLAAASGIHYVHGLPALSHFGMSYMGALMFVAGALMALTPIGGHRQPAAAATGHHAPERVARR